MSSSEIKCQLCDKGINECGGWLERVNEKGVPGVYECRPSCTAVMNRDEAVVNAVKGEEE